MILPAGRLPEGLRQCSARDLDIDTWCTNVEDRTEVRLVISADLSDLVTGSVVTTVCPVSRHNERTRVDNVLTEGRIGVITELPKLKQGKRKVKFASDGRIWKIAPEFLILSSEIEVQERSSSVSTNESDDIEACRAAWAQLEEAVAVVVEGLPEIECNGVYMAVSKPSQVFNSDVEWAWMRFQSAEGKHLWRHIPTGEWRLGHAFGNPDEVDPSKEDPENVVASFVSGDHPSIHGAEPWDGLLRCNGVYLAPEPLPQPEAEEEVEELDELALMLRQTTWGTEDAAESDESVAAGMVVWVFDNPEPKGDGWRADAARAKYHAKKTKERAILTAKEADRRFGLKEKAEAAAVKAKEAAEQAKRLKEEAKAKAEEIAQQALVMAGVREAEPELAPEPDPVWWVRVGRKWEERILTVTLLREEAFWIAGPQVINVFDESVSLGLAIQKTAVELEQQRLCEVREGVVRSTTIRAQDQLNGLSSVVVSGMPIESYNGCYETVGEHDGWRRFENEAGKHLFRYAPDREWHLHGSFYPAPPVRFTLKK